MSKTIWETQSHHGELHPTVEDSVYFAIAVVEGRGQLTGFVPRAEFRRLARRFGVSAKVNVMRMNLAPRDPVPTPEALPGV